MYRSLITHVVLFGIFCGLGDCFLCEPGHIHCASKCIPLRYICDGDNDCGDSTDESFCSEWRSTGCSERGTAACNKITDGITSCVSMEEYCSASSQCAGIVDPRICVMIRNRVLQRISSVVVPEPITTTLSTTTLSTTTLSTTTSQPLRELNNLEKSELRGELFAETLNKTMEHPECPVLYTRVGEQCLSFFYILKLSWGEAKMFCELINGQLVSFGDNYEQFVTLMKHLREHGITSDFWIGGRHKDDTEGWKWLSDSDMELGSPFWAVRYEDSCNKREEEYSLATQYFINKTACYHYQQAPRPSSANLCSAMTYKHYHYVTDEDCLIPRSPLCLANSNGTSF
ncbi:uncharacterized protein [Palaemon carinicauda]|uniref:uncharacterized protein isoform X2 n=1 Tax=Palaemon carinicauda TaxID=392227 RepID=UPI0035B65B60